MLLVILPGESVYDVLLTLSLGTCDMFPLHDAMQVTSASNSLEVVAGSGEPDKNAPSAISTEH
eukprot:SAG25_NODE_493_length_7405_cov_1.946756_2_plen_63_part_00